MTGRVVLVGAGPGAADLVTVRAVRALAEADLVLYDALVDRALLEHAPRAQRFWVGKRAGRPSTPQKTIHALMIRAARRGKTVVRLKCGDPFVLGRGGEEVLALEEAGVPVEVVPGISSAIAAPAAAGIPVTHRGISPGFLVLSAVPAPHYQRVLGTLAPGSVTVVLLMALGARAAIRDFLLAAGWPAELPAAVVLDATLPGAWSWTGTLAELASVTLPRDAEARGLIVLGSVVSLAEVCARASTSKFEREEEEDAAWVESRAR